MQLFFQNLVAMATPNISSEHKFRKYFAQDRSYDLIIAIVFFLPKFGCHSNGICYLKNSNSIFEFANPANPIVRAKKVSILCTELINTYFCLNMVVMATLLTSLKILIAYFYSLTPKNCYSQLKVIDFLHRTEISAILADVCLNSIAMVTFLIP